MQTVVKIAVRMTEFELRARRGEATPIEVQACVHGALLMPTESRASPPCPCALARVGPHVCNAVCCVLCAVCCLPACLLPPVATCCHLPSHLKPLNPTTFMIVDPIAAVRAAAAAAALALGKKPAFGNQRRKGESAAAFRLRKAGLALGRRKSKLVTPRGTMRPTSSKQALRPSAVPSSHSFRVRLRRNARRNALQRTPDASRVAAALVGVDAEP